ncbi:MAG TPA: TerC family protein [Bacillales bacterium]|nr:TerC family protein [Bacillales bacterium]
MFDVQFFTALFSIFIINIVLSGDNAVVIALASRRLPNEQQKKAIWWGTVGAIGLRVILTFIAAWLLQIPFLQFVGGLLLIWIAYKLLNDDHDEGDNVNAATTLGKAIQTVIVADLVMSLDNVLAIAGIAGENFWLIVIGLAASVPLIIWGSTLLMKLMQKFPIIIWAGAGLLGWTAGEMINGDKIVGDYIESFLGSWHWLVPLVITIGILGISFLMQRRNKGEEANSEMEEEEDQDEDSSKKAQNVEG